MTVSTACPCCNQNEFFEVASFPDIPVSGIFRETPEQSVISHSVAFEACSACGLLRNPHFASPPAYEEKPRATDRQFPVYHDALLSMIGTSVAASDLIVEIGSNDGTFLELLRRNGFTNTYGVEPSSALAEASRARGFKTESGYFCREAVDGLLARHGAVKMAVCRHTLEHVPDPASFVGALRDLLLPGDACALVEVPESTVIAERMNFVELWDEHLYYFTARTLRRLFERNGLVVRSEAVYPHLDTRNLVMLVTPAGIPGDEILSQPINEAELWHGFVRRFEAGSARMKAVLKDAAHPVYLIGASHPQCNFVNYLDLGDFVDAMIDDDPIKHGKLPAIRSDRTRVVSSADFMTGTSGGTLLMTGFGYSGWTARLLEAATSRGMRVVDPAKSFVGQV